MNASSQRKHTTDRRCRKPSSKKNMKRVVVEKSRSRRMEWKKVFRKFHPSFSQFIESSAVARFSLLLHPPIDALLFSHSHTQIPPNPDDDLTPSHDCTHNSNGLFSRRLTASARLRLLLILSLTPQLRNLSRRTFYSTDDDDCCMLLL